MDFSWEDEEFRKLACLSAADLIVKLLLASNFKEVYYITKNIGFVDKALPKVVEAIQNGDDILIDEIISDILPEELKRLINDKWQDYDEVCISEQERSEVQDFLIEFKAWIITNKSGLLVTNIPTDIIKFLKGLRLDDEIKLWDYIEYDENMKAENVEYIDMALGSEVIKIKKMPSKRIINYLIEARQCFFNGFHLGTLVLCRAVMELVLQEKLINFHDSGTLSPDDLKAFKESFENREQNGDLKIIIKHAVRKEIISIELEEKCQKLRKSGGRTAHGKRSELKPEEALDLIKELFEHIYR